MKRFLLIFLLILIFYDIEAKDIPFKVERLITDFNGITTNGINTICYGDFGIMTYSLDTGKTWHQQNIGDKYNIKKIKTSANVFIGLTNFSLIKSTDNGLSWLNKIFLGESRLVDFTLDDNSIFILSNSSVLKSDINLNVASQPVLLLDSTSNYSELETDGVNLYIIKDEKYLLIYNLLSQELRSLNLIKDFNCIYCTKVSGIKIFDGKVYIQISQKAADGNFDSYFLYSNNNGKNWQKLTNQIQNSSCYKIINNQLFFFRPVEMSDSSYNSYLVNGYFKVDSSHFSQDSSYLTRLNPQENITRRIKFDKKFAYKDFIHFNNNIIIAVGTNKLISISHNNGKSFDFISYFQGIYDEYDNVNIISDSLIYINNGYEFYKTMNGGITWLPQNYFDYTSNIIYTHPDYYYFDSNGYGFAKFGSINTKNDSSALITYDYGENFIKSNKPEYVIPTYNNIYNKGIDLGDKFIFILNPTKRSLGDYSYLILRYDKSLRLIDSISLISDKIRNITKINDENLIALVLQSSGTNRADSNGKTNDYSYNYYLIQSKDKGRTWVKLKDYIPITQKLTQRFDSTYFYLDVTTDKSMVYNDLLLYPTINNLIYRYNHTKNTFDSITLPARIAYHNPIAFFKFNTNLYIVSNFSINTFYYSQVQDFDKTNWDSLTTEDVFFQWDQYNYQKQSNNQDVILMSKMLNDSIGFLVIGKSYISKTGAWEFKYNIVKIKSNIITDISENEFKIAQERVYLWNSSPYPIPGKSMIQSKIFWNSFYSISDIKLSVYDIYGTKLNNPKINIDASNAYSGLLKWDCSDISTGIYYIQVFLQGESISFPVIISK